MRKKFTSIYDSFVRNNKTLFLWTFFLYGGTSFAQPRPNPSTENWLMNPGILGTIFLIVIVAFIAVFILYFKIEKIVNSIYHNKSLKDKKQLKEELIDLTEVEIDDILEKRKAALNYKLTGNELGSENAAHDEKGMVAKVTHAPNHPMVDEESNQN